MAAISLGATGNCLVTIGIGSGVGSICALKAFAL